MWGKFGWKYLLLSYSNVCLHGITNMDMINVNYIAAFKNYLLKYWNSLYLLDKMETRKIN